jgi:hypothetical protein
MNTSVTLTAEEFKNLHNAMWHAESLGRRLGDHGDELLKLLREMRTALAGAYRQEEVALHRKMEFCDQIQEQSGFTGVWSIYSVDDFSEVPYPQSQRLIYNSHWGKNEIEVELAAQDWHALWSAANDAILKSGDLHHIYIEEIRPSHDDPTVLILHTGS